MNTPFQINLPDDADAQVPIYDLLDALGSYYNDPPRISTMISVEVQDERLLEILSLLFPGARTVQDGYHASPKLEPPPAVDAPWLTPVKVISAETAPAPEPTGPACPDCGAKVTADGRRCRSCAQKAARKARTAAYQTPEPEAVSRVAAVPQSPTLEPRYCKCGCGGVLDPFKPKSNFVNSKHAAHYYYEAAKTKQAAPDPVEPMREEPEPANDAPISTTGPQVVYDGDRSAAEVFRSIQRHGAIRGRKF